MNLEVRKLLLQCRRNFWISELYPVKVTVGCLPTLGPKTIDVFIARPKIALFLKRYDYEQLRIDLRE